MTALRLPSLKPCGNAGSCVSDLAIAEVGLVPIDVQPACFLFGVSEGLANDYCDGFGDTQLLGVGSLPGTEFREAGCEVGTAAKIVTWLFRIRWGFALLGVPVAFTI